MTRPFRFGVIARPDGGGAQWTARARRVADLGYGTLLVPDNLDAHAPLLALATAAAAVPGLRVGPFVLAAPLRPPRVVAWEAHTLSTLTDGRFDLGIGTGRPVARAEAESLGMRWGTGAERLDLVRETIARLRELDGERHTPVLMAASGPKALRLAAEVADVVTLAALPTTPVAEVRKIAAELRDRAPHVEVAMNQFAVGDEVPLWLARFAGTDPAELRTRETYALLRGSTAEMADELQRRRDELGVSYLVVSEPFAEALAPVVERLVGS